MNRKDALSKLKAETDWDVIVIGGGATGLGVAVDAVTRGYRTLLLEAKDFAKGTSSRSTKLLHGGVRYLAQGNIALVREALRERGRLAKNAPHLFHKQSFIIPSENCWQAPFYTLGLSVYDLLSGEWSIGRTRYLKQSEAQQRLQGVKKEKLLSGVCYYDGQFDDARLALTLAKTAQHHDACVLNYCTVVGLEKNEHGQLKGLQCRDELSGETHHVRGRCVVNATGAFADTILEWDGHTHKRLLLSQGIHLVLDADFLPSEDALMIPKTSDGRVLFAVPWHGKILLGTTDTPVSQAEYEPKPLKQEIQFILDTAKNYLQRTPTSDDVRSVFVGLRPLVQPKNYTQNSKEVSRSHTVEIEPSGLVNIFGGKWTTYRQMAQDGLDAAVAAHILPYKKPCCTENLPLYGSATDVEHFGASFLSVYGTDASHIKTLMQENESLARPIHVDYPYTYAQVQWAVEHEAAQTLEDVLARRVRLLFLDAQAALACAENVANFMASLLSWSDERLAQEIRSFTELAKQYCLKTYF